MSLTRNIRLVVPRLQQCLYTTGSAGSGSGSAGSGGSGATEKTSKATEKSKAAKPKQKATPAPQTKQEPFDNTKYQCNTYYEHKKWTFYDVESQMSSRRTGQPSPYAKK